MSSKIEIWNRALSNIGVKQFVQSESENSNEASVLGVHWDAAVRKTLVDHPWPFARAYRTLALIEQDPSTDWAYSYRYPTDCLMVRRIVSENGRTDPFPPPFAIGQDDQGGLIYTDYPDAVIEYTKSVTEPERFDVAFEEALVWYLSYMCAIPLSRISDMSKHAYIHYKEAIITASTKVQNESQQDLPQEAEWIQAR